jgi:cell division protein FtsL|tara:strand:+ start:2303 stop:2545 length:243 start_codon:yes stop_codon:yes gene_type:complete
MFKLFILITLVFISILIVRELRKYSTRDQKEEELRDIFIKGDLTDIELEIAEEKTRQEDVRAAMNDLKSENNNNKEKSND